MSPPVSTSGKSKLHLNTDNYGLHDRKQLNDVQLPTKNDFICKQKFQDKNSQLTLEKTNMMSFHTKIYKPHEPSFTQFFSFSIK